MLFRSWDHERLYALKGEIVRRGVEAITGISMPVFEKRRFQHGVAAPQALQGLLSADEDTFRHILRDKFSGRRPAATAGS